VILIVLPNTKNMNREQLKKALLQDELINTNECVVASIRMNKPIKYLIKKLGNLNYAINYRLNRYSLKKNSKFPRVGFYCLNQYSFNNTHSHIYLSVPPCYDYEDVINLMKREFIKLDHRTKPKYEIYTEPVRFADNYARYSVREFNNDDTDTFKVI